MKLLSGILVAAVFAVMTFAVWAYLNRPTREPPWPARHPGLCLLAVPRQRGPDALEMPTDAEIDSDLALLEGKVNAVRTYCVAATLADDPRARRRHGINVTLGAWLDSHLDKNEEQLQTVIDLADSTRTSCGSSSATRCCCAATCRSSELEQLPRPRARRHRPAGRHRRDLARLAGASRARRSTSTSSACTCCRTGRACRSTRRWITPWRSSSACSRPSRTSPS